MSQSLDFPGDETKPAEPAPGMMNVLVFLWLEASHVPVVQSASASSPHSTRFASDETSNGDPVESIKCCTWLCGQNH